MCTEADDLWVKVIHTEMEFDYKIPTTTVRFCFVLHCNSHNVTFPFKQLTTSFLVARFWNYQILPCAQPYTSEHKGPDVPRTEESLGFHANHSTSIMCSLPRLQMPCGVWMAASASSCIGDGRQPGRGQPCHMRILLKMLQEARCLETRQ